MTPRRPALLLIGGLPGCGKTTLAHEIARRTGFAVFDKDTLTRPLVEFLLVALGSRADDRESSSYRSIRHLEYECLVNVAVENAGLGVSTIAVAPFVKEAVDPGWYETILKRTQADVRCIWLTVSSKIMYRRVVARGETRDQHKLENWPEYVAEVRCISPLQPWSIFDSSEMKAEALAEKVIASIGDMSEPA